MDDTSYLFNVNIKQTRKKTMDTVLFLMLTLNKYLLFEKKAHNKQTTNPKSAKKSSTKFAQSSNIKFCFGVKIYDCSLLTLNYFTLIKLAVSFKINIFSIFFKIHK